MTGNRMSIAFSEKLKYSALVVILLGLVVLSVFEFKHFNRLLASKRFLLWAIAVAGILGASVGVRLARKLHDLTERVQMVVFFTVLSIFYAPLFSSLLNRAFPIWGSYQVEAEFISEKAFYAERFGVTKGSAPPPPSYYESHLYFKQEIYRFSHKKALYPTLRKGDQVPLTIWIGLWGFEFVDLPD
ncbi:MAG: hypothetical protein AAF798_19070 [Bacteroidota bacterium]